MRDDMDDPAPPSLSDESQPPAVIPPVDTADPPTDPTVSSKSPDFLDEFLVHATSSASATISPSSPTDDTPSHVDMADNDPFLAELFSQTPTTPATAPSPPPPPPPVEAVDREDPEKTGEGVFKRPFSPRASPDRGGGPGVTEGGVEAKDRGQFARMRREMRLQPHPHQRCFLTGIKQKRSDTDEGHMAAVLHALKDGGKLLLPDIVLRSYLEEAGLAVGDSKVARLVGAMAEEHTASIIQDSMQIYVDNQHERRRPPPAASAKDKETASGASSSQASVSTVASAPASGKGSKSKGGKSLNGKRTSKGKRRKADGDTGDPADDTSTSLDLEMETLERDPPDHPPGAVVPEGDGEAPKDAEKALSLASKEEAKRPNKREREKETERRNVLGMEVLGPVLREHGYHVGRPPYFVN